MIDPETAAKYKNTSYKASMNSSHAYASLIENTFECSATYFPVHRNDASAIAPPQNSVASLLSFENKAEAFQGAFRLLA